MRTPSGTPDPAAAVRRSLRRLLAAGISVVAVAFVDAAAGVGYGVYGPDTWQIEREVAADAAPADVAYFVHDVEHWRQWVFVGDGATGDSEVVVGETADGVGAAVRWRRGRTYGHATIDAIDGDATSMRIHRGATNPDADAPSYESRVTVRLAPTPDGGTRILWRDEGAFGARPFGPYLVGSYARSLETDVDSALASLAALAEARSEARREGQAILP